jgi:hypothetical protein
MKSEDVRRELIESTGIDFSAYQHEELVDAIDVTSSTFDSIGGATLWAADPPNEYWRTCSSAHNSKVGIGRVHWLETSPNNWRTPSEA